MAQAATKPKYAPMLGPWRIVRGEIVAADGEVIGEVFRSEAWSDGDPVTSEDQANAALIGAAHELLSAAEKLEAAETFSANCDECEGEDVPEICAKCFPLFDDARIARRLAIAKAHPETAVSP